MWIDLLGPRPKHQLKPEALVELAICGPVFQEVLQGVRDDLAHAKIRAALSAFVWVGDPLSRTYFIEAAALYRLARKKGLTIRSATDALIAAIAIRHEATVWHNDRDYDALAKISPLRVLRAL